MLRLAPLIPLLAAVVAATPPAGKNTCVDCHGDVLEQAGADVHRRGGLACVECHGGDATKDEPEAAMSTAKGFVGAPRGMRVVSVCGGCHGDIERMRVLNPRLPTDQLAHYKTSGHGKRAEKGDMRVATCASCHGFHGVRRVSDPLSPVSPVRIVETCGSCHNPQYMKGRSIATDQLEAYRSSVHGKRRLEERDPSAPACKDCHGNHGAAPPGVFAVTHVCGTCHQTQAETFDGSSHAAIFREAGMAPCTTCHDHHAIRPTSDDMLGVGPNGVCKACHEVGDKCDVATAAMNKDLHDLATAVTRAEANLARADRLGMDVDQPTYELASAREALVLARVQVHSFSQAHFHEVAAEGLATAQAVDKAALAKLEEYQYRRRGLAVASAFLVALAALLAVKVRTIERRRLASLESTPPSGTT